jgi:hypothetical protein
MVAHGAGTWKEPGGGVTVSRQEAWLKSLGWSKFAEVRGYSAWAWGRRHTQTRLPSFTRVPTVGQPVEASALSRI